MWNTISTKSVQYSGSIKRQNVLCVERISKIQYWTTYHPLTKEWLGLCKTMVETQNLEVLRSLILKMRTITHKKIHKKLQSDSSRYRQPLNYEISCQIFKVSNTEQRELRIITVDQSGIVNSNSFRISYNWRTQESIESTLKINEKNKSKKSLQEEKNKSKDKIRTASLKSIWERLVFTKNNLSKSMTLSSEVFRLQWVRMWMLTSNLK